MIKGLYETHLFVESLERSIDFYKNLLGLEHCSSVFGILKISFKRIQKQY